MHKIFKMKTKGNKRSTITNAHKSNFFAFVEYCFLIAMLGEEKLNIVWILLTSSFKYFCIGKNCAFIQYINPWKYIELFIMNNFDFSWLVLANSREDSYEQFWDISWHEILQFSLIPQKTGNLHHVLILSMEMLCNTDYCLGGLESFCNWGMLTNPLSKQFRILLWDFGTMPRSWVLLSLVGDLCDKEHWVMSLEGLREDSIAR